MTSAHATKCRKLEKKVKRQNESTFRLLPLSSRFQKKDRERLFKHVQALEPSGSLVNLPVELHQRLSEAPSLSELGQLSTLDYSGDFQGYGEHAIVVNCQPSLFPYAPQQLSSPSDDIEISHFHKIMRLRGKRRTEEVLTSRHFL